MDDYALEWMRARKAGYAGDMGSYFRDLGLLYDFYTDLKAKIAVEDNASCPVVLVAEHIGEACPHGNDPTDCNDCFVASDMAFDAAREARR